MKKNPHMHPAFHVHIPTDPNKIIEFVEFDYDCSFYLKATAWLCIDGKPSDIRCLTECPCAWKLNRKVNKLELLSSISLQSECLHMQVQYEPEEWVPIAPNESYPLPPDPPEISRITFEAKTDAGTTSQMTLFIEGDPNISDTITETPKTENWGVGFTIPVEYVSLKNTGGSTVYIRNLTTE